MFEKAARLKLRFDTPKGQLSVEELWQLPLTSNNGTDLDAIAIRLDRELKETAKVSFVKMAPQENNTAELKFEIVKHIIDTRLREQEEKKNEREVQAKRQKIMELIEAKDNEEMSGMSKEELLKLRDSLPKPKAE